MASKSFTPVSIVGVSRFTGLTASPREVGTKFAVAFSYFYGELFSAGMSLLRFKRAEHCRGVGPRPEREKSGAGKGEKVYCPVA